MPMNTVTDIAIPQQKASKGKKKADPVVDAQGTTIKIIHDINVLVFIINLFNADMYVVI